MRFERLGLVRFGKFTDHELQFPLPKKGISDVHLVYGPNEAGKSTLFAAMLDLMFGIPDRTAYGFLHDYSAMRIEGRLRHKGDSVELARIKRRTDDLLGTDGRALTHNPLVEMLGGLDRSGYQAMFSLDETSLEAGGRELLNANGDFGRILFSASSGLSDLTSRLKELDAEADTFYRRGGRNHRLRELMDMLETLRQEQEANDVHAANFDRLISNRDASKLAKQLAEEEELAARKKYHSLSRQLDVLSKLEDYRIAKAAVEKLRDLPIPSPDAREKLELIRDAESSLTTRQGEINRRIAVQKDKLSTLEIDTIALSARHQIDAATDLVSRFKTASQDLPKRQRSLDETEAEISALTRKLSNKTDEDVHALFLKAEQIAKIYELADKWPVLNERLENAQAEVTSAEVVIQVPTLTEAEHAQLKVTLNAARSSDAVARLHQSSRDKQAIEIDLVTALQRLAPWEGNAEALKLLQLPATDVLEDWKTDLHNLRTEKTNIEDSIDAARSAYALAAANIDIYTNLTMGLDDTSLSDLKINRDTAWQHHKEKLSLETADTFALEMLALDQAINARLTHTTKLAELEIAKSTAAEEEAKINERQKSLEKCDHKIETIKKEILNTADLIGLHPATTPETLIKWGQDREEALAVNMRKVAASARCTEAQLEIDSLVLDLSKVLQMDGNLATLSEAADSRLKESEIARQSLNALNARKNALIRAEENLKTWSIKWTEALGNSWIKRFANTPELVRDALSELRDLEDLVRKRDEMLKRVRDMSEDQENFITQVNKALSHLGATGTKDDPIGDYEYLKTRLDKAREVSEEAKRLQNSLAVESETAATVERELEDHTARKEKLLAALGVSTLADAGRILDEITEARASSDTVTRLEREILEAAAVDDPIAALELLEKMDSASLQGEMALINSEITALAEETRDRHADVRDAQTALDAIGGDSVAAALQTRRHTVLEEIVEGTKKAIRLRLGALAAKSAMEAFRAEQQSSMLKFASEAFGKITGGAYQGLRTQAGEKGEELIAIAANGASRIEDEQMSAGTRAQLYLALRIAGFHTFADEYLPPPFVADDIFETFDDNRAKEAFRLLGGMGERGQVIYLTHHQHLLDIASDVIPGVNIIML